MTTLLWSKRPLSNRPDVTMQMVTGTNSLSETTETATGTLNDDVNIKYHDIVIKRQPKRSQLHWYEQHKLWMVTKTATLILSKSVNNKTQIAMFMGPTWGPPGSCRPQMGPMLAPWTLLSGHNWTGWWMVRRVINTNLSLHVSTLIWYHSGQQEIHSGNSECKYDKCFTIYDILL